MVRVWQAWTVPGTARHSSLAQGRATLLDAELGKQCTGTILACTCALTSRPSQVREAVHRYETRSTKPGASTSAVSVRGVAAQEQAFSVVAPQLLWNSSTTTTSLVNWRTPGELPGELLPLSFLSNEGSKHTCFSLHLVAEWLWHTIYGMYASLISHLFPLV